MSYCPSTRADIHPRSIPTSTAATRLATAPVTPPVRPSSLSVSGRSRRWNEPTLAVTQPLRSVTRARAGPARLRSPVACATSSSASAVASSKSRCSDWARYDSANGSRPAALTATRRASSQSTGPASANGYSSPP